MTVEKTVQELSAGAHADGWLREKVTRIFDLFIFSLLPASSFMFAILAVLTPISLALNYMVGIVEYLTTPWRRSGES